MPRVGDRAALASLVVHAVAEGAREAPGYRLLAAVIRAGCKAAIRISEKI